MQKKPENILIKKIKAEIDENVVLKKLQEEYSDQITEMLEFDEFNIGDKLAMNSHYQENFRLLYISEKQKLNRIEDMFNEKAGEKYDYYKHNDGRDLNKQEIERYYLPKDEELIKLKKLIRLQETRVEFFAAVAESFKSQGFNMRTFMDNLKVGG